MNKLVSYGSALSLILTHNHFPVEKINHSLGAPSYYNLSYQRAITQLCWIEIWRRSINLYKLSTQNPLKVYLNRAVGYDIEHHLMFCYPEKINFCNVFTSRWLQFIVNAGLHFPILAIELDSNPVKKSIVFISPYFKFSLGGSWEWVGLLCLPAIEAYMNWY